MPVINIKILSLGTPERYSMRRIVMAAQLELQSVDPQFQTTISEVDHADQIIRYATFLVLPTLVIDEKVVCSGRFPTRKEVKGWLREAKNKTQDVEKGL
jgi:hypothetical protein